MGMQYHFTMQCSIGCITLDASLRVIHTFYAPSQGLAVIQLSSVGYKQSEEAFHSKPEGTS